METALAVMQEAVEFVQKQKEIYIKSLDTHLLLFAPINNIPFDVHSRIFVDLHGLDLDEFHSGLTAHIRTDRFYNLNEGSPPTLPSITVAQVSRQWSQVAMRTPALWSTLVFSADIDYEGQLASASEWLKRSEGSPLTCIILDDVCLKRNRGKSCKMWLPEPSLIHILLPHVSRIRTLRIFGEYFPFLCRLRDGNAAFSALETLELDDCEGVDEEPEEVIGLNAGPIRSFKSSPGVNLDHFIFDRRSLQSFTGKLYDRHQLHQLPSLRRCRIRIASHDEDAPGLPASPTQTPHFLTVLWIDLSLDEDDALGQLGHFPHLQSLVFRRPEPDECIGLLSFLQTSRQSLRYLSLLFEEFPDPEVLCRLLEFTPKLERLDCILEEYSAGRFFELLAEGNLVLRLCDLYISVMRGRRMGDWSTELWTLPDDPPPTTRSPFNITFCHTSGSAKRLPCSERQWEDATRSMIENYLPGCKTHYLWKTDLDDMMFFGKRPGAPMDGLEEL